MPTPTPTPTLDAHRTRHLAALLAAFRPTDEREAQDLAAICALLTRASDPFHRAHFAPGHVTASAFVLAPDGPDLLLVWHPRLERWLQPGGHVDPGDPDIVAAARREVGEETGLEDLVPLVDGIFDLDIHDIPARREEPAHQHFDVRFLFRAATRDLRLTQEIKRARWLDLDRVSALESDASVARAVRKLRRLP